MKTSDARKLIKEYYADQGARAAVVKKLTRVIQYESGPYEEESFLCRVSEPGKIVPTICTINLDSHLKPYATEYTYGDDEKALEEGWVNYAEE